MKYRGDVADMLRAGHSQAEIMRTLHVSYPTVKAAREAIRFPAPGMGRRPIEPLHEAFAARTEAVEGGHLRWTGHSDEQGTPRLGNARRMVSVHKLAFRIRHGRDPVGRVTTGCDLPGCVAPEHVEDQPMRQRNRATFAAIFGGSE